ncbi:hypothetical protein LJ737_15485 [Hymenobacter sp. 15J16-1T3B]|uniref:BT4734/BF3469 family protein n=1 Tax=Hymenobacter sp. 15J16-1T3B TaxID=2886941 RepID=UPI001D12E1B2|nr:BT4734/BF3469 family protein [Hymenobacter sp. 15J16-1T3B]MCC3158650.1 hypothetical protein [Hymenobacter sp. 15J16-1T3B]
MMVVTKNYPDGVPVPSGNTAQLATRIQAALDPDKLYTRAQALRHLASVGCSDPAGWLAAAISAGWLEVYPDQTVGYGSRCWLPAKHALGQEAALPLFSYYDGPITNVQPSKAIDAAQLWQLLTSSALEKVTRELRTQPAGSSRRKYLKASLPFVTPAGLFARRVNGQLNTPSGLLVLDFDHVADLSRVKDTLLADPTLPIDLLFTSPSGDGIKAFVRVSSKHTHEDNFRGVSNFLKDVHGLTPDPSGKDVARACFACHDPLAWLHPRYSNTASIVHPW